jgi:predicted nucleic acid-binding protein
VSSYLDSDIIINSVSQDPTRGSKADQALAQAQANNPPLVISDLSRLECTIHAVRHPQTGLLYDYRRFFNASAMRTAPLIAAVYERAADLRAAHGNLRTPDALHLACALEYGCTDFLTHDQNLRGFPGINVLIVL